MPQAEIGREQLLKLRPSAILKRHGCVDDKGKPRVELRGDLVTATCIAFEDGQVAPQELLTVYEAIKQCLKVADADSPAKKFQQATNEAFEVTASLLQKDVNAAIVGWVREWPPFIDSDASIAAFMSHMSAVVQQYTVTMSLKYGE
jgi:hypothetical protein